MIKSSLSPIQRRTMDIIEGLGFGRIEQLSIRDGAPFYEPAPWIVQEIHLRSDHDRTADRSGTDHTIKKEFQSLFEQLSRLGDGIVDIDVRHGAPFRLVLVRHHEDLL